MNDLNTVCMCMCVRWVMACVCGHVNTICAVCTGCELTDPFGSGPPGGHRHLYSNI